MRGSIPVGAAIRGAATVVTIALLGFACVERPAVMSGEPSWLVDGDGDSPGYGTVVLRGFAAGETARFAGLDHDDWVLRFPVYTEDAATRDDRPPVEGDYFIEGDTVRFVPDHPWLPGTTFVVRWTAPDGAVRAERRLTLPTDARAPSTSVLEVYPSVDEVPENLLKLYVQFSAPMTRGEAARRVRLLDGSGVALPSPWVAPRHELWNSSVDRLTLFFDPGRIKQGVQPNATQGPPLVAGRQYRLVIDAGWLDAGGTPLVRSYEKRFRVLAADRRSPDPRRWTVHVPRTRSEALEVSFDEPLDRALAERMIAVEDARGATLAGDAEVVAGERRWRFVPRDPWNPGAYVLVVDDALEDLAGNSPRRRFDALPAEGRGVSESIRVPFSLPTIPPTP